MSYRQLEVWQLARELSVDIHRMTLECLPRLELYESGSQIRRSIKSVRSNIVEGYGRKRYPLEFARFVTYALASCDETTDHLETLRETGSLTDTQIFESIHERLLILGRKLNRLVQSVDARINSGVRESSASRYAVDGTVLDSERILSEPDRLQPPATSDQPPVTSDQKPTTSHERQDPDTP
jgi:four helix bundle protein